MLLFYPVARGNIEDISLKSSTQMLKKPVWENLFKFPENTPLHSFEFYADSAFQRSFTFEPKASRLRSSETGGAQLILQGPEGPKTLHSTLLDPSSFSELLRGHRTPNYPTVFTRCTEPNGKSWDRAREIEQACRRILLDLGNVSDFRARYEEITKHFLFANSDTKLEEGQEALARFSVEFLATKGEQSRRFKIQRGRTDIESFVSELEQTLMTREHLDKALQHPWPSPKGRLAILWSPSCVAKLLLHFIQHFEFLSRTHESFEHLKGAFPQLSFQVIDNWKQQNRVDVEGRPRRETLLIDGSTPAVIFNEQVPGFSRRSSSRDFPITAPWEPALFGKERDSNIFAQLGNGISIRELEVLSFHVSSGLITLRISEAALVHQGIEGEFIEPVTWELPLLDLLSSFKLFSDSSIPHPLAWAQQGQELFVEVTSSAALSSALEFPGTVPLAHYW
ncbi:MAG: hypothetical protein EBQ92_04395 [Proteobacteria bacterium]|nr:hypothetical protein [Pseudomonadota bacterium]